MLLRINCNNNIVFCTKNNSRIHRYQYTTSGGYRYKKRKPMSLADPTIAQPSRARDIYIIETTDPDDMNGMSTKMG